MTSSKALSAATSSSPVRSRPVVHWFGQSDLLVSGSRTDIEARLLPFAFEAGLLGVSSVVEAADRARDLSLLTRVSPEAPPFLIAHGDRDHVVAPSEGEALHDALSRAGAADGYNPPMSGIEGWNIATD